MPVRAHECRSSNVFPGFSCPLMQRNARVGTVEGQTTPFMTGRQGWESESEKERDSESEGKREDDMRV